MVLNTIKNSEISHIHVLTIGNY